MLSAISTCRVNPGCGSEANLIKLLNGLSAVQFFKALYCLADTLSTARDNRVKAVWQAIRIIT